MPKKDFPIYRLVISDQPDQSGVDYVAMVDEPAIEERGMWMMFAKQKDFSFKSTEPEKRIVSGFLMVADMPIYRKDDSRGEYYVVFEAQTIDQIRKKFAKNNYFNNVNAMHDKSLKLEGVYMVDNFAIDSARGINTPKGFEKAPDGSWFASYYIENETLWAEFLKTGVLKGFSVEGLFGYDLEEKAENKEDAENFAVFMNLFLDSLKS